VRPWFLCAVLGVSLGASAAFGVSGDALADGAKSVKPAPAKQLTIVERLKRAGWVSALAETRAEHAKRQWEHLSSVDGAECREALKKTGAVFRSLQDRQKPDKNGCGIPHGVIVTKGPTGITYSGPLMIDCSLALSLTSVEKVIQEEAMRHLGQPITRVTTLGSYSCRSVRGWKERISQHAIGNAMDMASFTPKKGQAASVMRDYQVGVEQPTTPRGRFLRAIYGRLWSEGGVTRVLGPEWDAAHRDHFHLDGGLRFWRQK
jgi:hypothetical protein